MAAMKNIVGQLMGDHQGEIVIGSAMPEKGSTHHYPLSIRPGIDLVAWNELDVCGTAGLGGKFHVSPAPSP